MTFLDQLKKLDAMRNEGPWSLAPVHSDIPEDGVYIRGKQTHSWPLGYPVAEQIDDEDAEFIVMLANNTQAIIELVEAVKNLRHHNKFDGTWVEANDWERMQDALAKLKGDV
jgi:hypothetical protein